MGNDNLQCKICEAESAFFCRARILSRHDIAYFRCPACGFVQTEEPFWLDEAYRNAIADADVGLVQRNLRRVPVVMAVIRSFFRGNGKFIDYGGGYGLLVRLMRDAGFDFFHYDRHCLNLFAKGFKAEPPGGNEYELLTAMELFEHLADPMGEVGRMLDYSRSIFFTTELVPTPTPRPGEWWYYALDQGQHVAFYTRKSLEIMAERLRLSLVTDGTSRHLLTERPVAPLLFSIVSKYKTGVLLSPFLRRKSLIPIDCQKMTGGGKAV